MKIGRREVNLALGILSLIVIAVFFFMYYSPKQSLYESKLEELEDIDNYIRQAKQTVDQIPTLQENVQIYENKKHEIEEIIPRELNHLEAIVTIEKLAKDTKVDLVKFVEQRPKNYQATVPVNNTCETPNVKGFTNNGEKLYAESSHAAFNNITAEKCFANKEDAEKEGYKAAPADLQVQNNNPDPLIPSTTTGGLQYDIQIKGEYRSIMSFLYQIQNVSYYNKIENFKLEYNGVDEGNLGYPLVATFRIVFIDRSYQPSSPTSSFAQQNMNIPAPTTQFQNNINSNQNQTSSNNSSSCNIKGNHSSSGEKIYHMPGGAYYDATVAEVMFCSEEEAIAQGFRRSQR